MKKFIFIILLLLYYTDFLTGAGNKISNEISIAKINYLIEIGDFQNAYKELPSIDISKIPSDKKALFYNKAGFINYKLNNNENALKNYFSAVTLNSNLYFVYNNIGVIYYSLKQFNKAKEYYLKALDKNKNYPRVLVNLAVVDFFLKNYKNAYEWLKNALNCDKKYVKKRFDKKKAIQKLKEWVHQNPDDKDLKKMLEWLNKNPDKDITDFNF